MSGHYISFVGVFFFNSFVGVQNVIFIWFGAGCSKTAEIIPSSTLTTQIEWNDAQTRRPVGRRVFNLSNLEKKR